MRVNVRVEKMLVGCFKSRVNCQKHPPFPLNIIIGF